MSVLIPINNVNVVFEVVGDEIFATSLQVAEVFEKRHTHILDIIKDYPSDDFRELNFRLTERTAKFGAVVRSEPYYKISRDGFSLLVMGFTGEKAYRWKIEFIAAFNKMEAMIKNGSIANDKFTEVLTALKDKSTEADNAKLEILTLKDELISTQRKLIEKLENTKNNELQTIKKSTRLNKSEKDEIVRLYKSGLSQGEICRRMDRSRDAVRNAIRGVL
ncbi:Rha family transcriptional regulator [Campylobacter gastrosuis]|uniref:Rha family transcriptional regulator n=1 Tax=Campylobacter gastrosuis TaxID=2974576 RepID=A0ABT7HMJ9_9BACT|nr:Rha family transcriptional regulator [Campylobacter gastrosuis]MDL0088146.1 Rha family transcriptional regulator [Campylobacter gastrosuis]